MTATKKRLMNFRLPAGLFLVFLFGFVKLQTASGTPGQDTGKSFLWQVRSQAGGTVYLLGSIHFAKPDLYPLAPAILEAFDRSKTLAVEADVRDSRTAQSLAAVMKAAVYRQGSLKDHVPAPVYKTLAKELQSLGASVEMFSAYKPWFTAMQLSALKLLEMGASPEYGLDKYFLDRAGSRRIVELEGVERQMQMLDRLPERDQARFLIYTIKGLAEIEKALPALVQAWKNGEAELLADAVVRKPLREEPGLAPLMEKLFFQRNEEMAEKVLKLLASDGPAFVVVGAGHLVGERGILDLLKQKGLDPVQL